MNIKNTKIPDIKYPKKILYRLKLPDVYNKYRYTTFVNEYDNSTRECVFFLSWLKKIAENRLFIVRPMKAKMNTYLYVR